MPSKHITNGFLIFTSISADICNDMQNDRNLVIMSTADPHIHKQPMNAYIQALGIFCKLTGTKEEAKYLKSCVHEN